MRIKQNAQEFLDVYPEDRDIEKSQSPSNALKKPIFRLSKMDNVELSARGVEGEKCQHLLVPVLISEGIGRELELEAPDNSLSEHDGGDGNARSLLSQCDLK